MDEQEFLHKVSVATNVNIELLKDLIGNEKFMGPIRAGQTTAAIMVFRDINSRIGLYQAKKLVDAFIEEFK